MGVACFNKEGVRNLETFMYQNRLIPGQKTAHRCRLRGTKLWDRVAAKGGGREGDTKAEQASPKYP